MIIELIKFTIYSLLIVIVSKYLLVTLLRKFAESIDLDVNVSGKIAGIATSVPELLTVSFSAINGLMDTSLFNIIGSNVINFIQYMASIFMNNNRRLLNNKVVKIDLVLVIFTIIIPIFLFVINFESSIVVVPVYILLGILFFIINKNAYKLYYNKDNSKKEEETEKNKKSKILNNKVFSVIKYSIGLIIVGIILYIIGNDLSESLEQLCYRFGFSEIILGLLLGFITSLPELITFFESQKHYKKSEVHDDELGVFEATNNLLTSNYMNLFVIQTIGILLYTFIFK